MSWANAATGSLPNTDEVPFRRRPGGADLSLVIRRVLRVGPNAGAPPEDYGVVADERHNLTRNDIMNNDADLMITAAGLLGNGVPRRVDVPLSEVDGDLTATSAVLGIDRADVVVDGRPRLSVDLGGNSGPGVVPGAGTPEMVRIEGYDRGVLAAARTFVRKVPALQLRTTFEPPS
ncbi:MAG TPA: hypothetical protein VFX88_06575 [Actinomycetota bacterium]|nr:hypothetical protein [Actinomycetota bacterium]